MARLLYLAILFVAALFASVLSCFANVRCGICIGNGDVSCSGLSTFPGNAKCSVGPLFIGSSEANWFSVGWNLSSLHRSPNKVLKLCLICLGPLLRHDSPRSPLASTMVPHTTDAYVWLTCYAKEPESDCNTDCFVRQT